jgi:hypothetical protein
VFVCALHVVSPRDLWPRWQFNVKVNVNCKHERHTRLRDNHSYERYTSARGTHARTERSSRALQANRHARDDVFRVTVDIPKFGAQLHLLPEPRSARQSCPM